MAEREVSFQEGDIVQVRGVGMPELVVLGRDQRNPDYNLWKVRMPTGYVTTYWEQDLKFVLDEDQRELTRLAYERHKGRMEGINQRFEQDKATSQRWLDAEIKQIKERTWGC